MEGAGFSANAHDLLKERINEAVEEGLELIGISPVGALTGLLREPED